MIEFDSISNNISILLLDHCRNAETRLYFSKLFGIFLGGVMWLTGEVWAIYMSRSGSVADLEAGWPPWK